MKKIIFKGAGAACITPMKKDGTVNYNVLTELLEYQIKNGTDAIVVCGTTGESATLSREERSEIVKHTVKCVNKRVPVVAGTGSNSTKIALDYSLEAESLGADALLIVTPYYNKTSQAGLISHYTHIAERVSKPIILYNVPSRTGVNIQPQTYLELSKHENIVATKEANGDLSSVAHTISLCKNNLNIYSGEDSQTVPILSLGGIGVIATVSNVIPRQTHEMVHKYLNGEVKESATLQIKYLELARTLFCDVNPIPVKEALNMMGFDCGKCRMPLCELSAENKEKMKAVLKKYNLI